MSTCTFCNKDLPESEYESPWKGEPACYDCHKLLQEASECQGSNSELIRLLHRLCDEICLERMAARAQERLAAEKAQKEAQDRLSSEQQAKRLAQAEVVARANPEAFLALPEDLVRAGGLGDLLDCLKAGK
jgi:hypothetical protein